ncbi:segregation and condensation protein A [Streptomyces lancefieldiae]|uniref:Segregation and condensation protein A n=1 Tax=Streptomyces lancefieldiae TaxID=3075520 RepID=A0ABU3AMK8_9ACTN|nr:segregation/condensation protein A [Streptomyces sp. DSM 40712]MDT0611424.1 segregation/condensation protein A [Streptomyces sp. DSM 40712]
MTSNDAPRPGARAGRRRALGRGPGERVAPPVAPISDTPDASEVPEESPSGAEPRGSAVARATSGTHPDITVSTASPHGDTTSAAASHAVAEPDAGCAAREAGARGEAETEASPRPSRPRTAPQAPDLALEAGGVAHGSAGRENPPQGAPGPGSAADGAHERAGCASLAPGGGPEDPVDAPGDGVFTVRLANFEGPFDLLLQLISKHKMDVTEVALSKVTDEFMAHIRAMGPDWDLDETTEFLVVAATLLDLKAARLLPAAEVEDEADLALLEARDLLFARLLQYRAYKRIAEIFNERLDAEARRYPRTVGLEPHHAELLPEVVISIGPEGFAGLAVKAMQPKPRPQVYVEHIHAPLVSVQEQAGIVVARLRELGEASFRALVEDTEDTLTVVARFLALLELYREKAVELDQETALGDLLVRWTGGDADAEPVVTDEFDRPPEEPEEEQKA